MARDFVLQPFRAPLELEIDYAHELNEQQLAAVTAEPGPALVIAGAGSGKTRTLTYRVAFLLEQGIPPECILLLTFTNKAAREMMRRVTDLLGQELGSLWGGTFHSIGNRILRRHAPALGYERDFTILDREDAKHLISTCVAEVFGEKPGKDFPKADALGDMFSLAINRQQTLGEFLEKEHGGWDEHNALIAKIHERYGRRKRETNVMDFDDLLALWLRLLLEQPEARDHYQRRFQFILVDEYQDTNKLQSEIIDLLGARHHNVMVVGDDAQSIYSWRGANFQNILHFPDRYPEARIYKIEANYRSTPEILNVANAAICANLRQFAKNLTTARPSGQKPGLVVCPDASDQAAFVAQRVLGLREEGVALNKVAVLYRSHFHALELQLELTRLHIPFSITSGIRFFEQAHIKDVTAYLKLVANPHDELAFKRLVVLLPGIGNKGAERLWQAYKAHAPARAAQAERTGPEPGGTAADCPVGRALQACAEKVPRRAAVAWAQFAATLSQLERERRPGRLTEMLELIIEADYEDYLKNHYDNYKSRLDDLAQLAVFAHQFADLDEFLTQLALLTSVEAESEQPARDDEDQLRLSTVHQAKGLEFDVVFVIMLCDGLFPSQRSLEALDGEEEERRLLYVAITRARNDLYLCYPLVRAGFGKADDLPQQRSRFLSEIPLALLEEWNLRHYA